MVIPTITNIESLTGWLYLYGEADKVYEDYEFDSLEALEKFKEDLYENDWEGMWHELRTEISYTFIEKPNDGVVLQESSMNLHGATYQPQELENSTHMQMRNNEAIKLALIKLYDGKFGDFFKTYDR